MFIRKFYDTATAEPATQVEEPIVEELGGAAALAALGAGGAAVNDMVVGRQRDPGGLLESLRAAAERDPRALPLYERELRRMGGTPPAPGAAPPSVSPEAMELFGYAPLTAAKNALTQKSPSSLPASRGPAGNRVGAAAPDATFEKLMERQGELAKEGAELRKQAADKSPVTDYAKQRREFDLMNALNVPDPMNSRAISDAMIAFGGKLLASEGRDVGGGVQEGGKAWMAGRDRSEKQAQDAQDRRLKNFMDTMGLSQKDAESLTAKDKAVLEAALAGIGAKGIDIAPRLEYAKEGRKEAHDLEKVDRQGQWHVKSAQASHQPKTSLTQQLDEYMAAVKKHGADPTNPFLRKGRDTPDAKFDKNEYDAAAAAAQTLTGQIKDPEKRKAALGAWQMDAINPAIGPQAATAKLHQYINRPVGG